jgi:hypothetical protein
MYSARRTSKRYVSAHNFSYLLTITHICSHNYIAHNCSYNVLYKCGKKSIFSKKYTYIPNLTPPILTRTLNIPNTKVYNNTNCCILNKIISYTVTK